MNLRTYLKAAIIDLRMLLAGKRDPDVPPLRLQFVGTGEFRETGRHLAELLTHTGGLRPDDRMLDVGCGIGRVAIPLAQYLSPRGSYDGFDIVPSAIRWCKAHISRRFPRFRFHLANVRNQEYNRRGIPAVSYRFPFADESFDFAFATSLYTHLTVEETAQYIRETARVLRPGGTFFGSFFLLNDELLPHLADVPVLKFVHEQNGMRVVDPHNPAQAVAMPEATVTRLLAEAGFVDVRIVPGFWPGGREEAVTYQDVVLGRKG